MISISWPIGWIVSNFARYSEVNANVKRIDLKIWIQVKATLGAIYYRINQELKKWVSLLQFSIARIITNRKNRVSYTLKLLKRINIETQISRKISLVMRRKSSSEITKKNLDDRVWCHLDLTEDLQW